MTSKGTSPCSTRLAEREALRKSLSCLPKPLMSWSSLQATYQLCPYEEPLLDPPLGTASPTQIGFERFGGLAHTLCTVPRDGVNSKAAADSASNYEDGPLINA